MFEAWQIGVRLSLINQVSPVLMTLSRQFAGAHRDAEKLNTLLAQMGRLTLVGSAVGGAGLFGLGALSKMLKPAEEYTHQLQSMNRAGMDQAQIAQAVGAAWKQTGENLTTTATGNLKAILDLRNALGSVDEAVALMPIAQRMQTILAASKEGKVSAHAGDLAFSAVKALDIRGAVNDPENLKRQADLMTRVIAATQGRVTPQMFQSVFQYARQAKFAMSDDFAYKILPTLMLEASTSQGGGGGSRGVGPGIAALYRMTNQGYVNKKSLPLLAELGLVNPGSQLHTTTSGTTVGPMRGASFAADNPFEWATTQVAPAIHAYMQKHHIANTTQNVLQIVGEAFRGNQLAASLVGEFIVKEKNFRRDQRLIEGTASPDEMFKAAMSNDPNTAHLALKAAWENFETSLMINVVPVIVPALLDLSKGLKVVGDWARDHPDLTKDLVIGLGALAATMAIGGPLLVGLAATRIAFAGLPGLLTGAGGAVEALGVFGTTVKWLSGAALAGGIGYGIGTFINSQIEGTKVGDAVGDFVGGFADIVSSPFSSEARHRLATANPGLFGSQAPLSEDARRRFAMANPELFGQTVRAGKGPYVQVTTKLHMDKRQIAEFVTDHQTDWLSRPLAGSSFDPTMYLRPVAAPDR